MLINIKINLHTNSHTNRLKHNLKITLSFCQKEKKATHSDAQVRTVNEGQYFAG